MKTIAVYNIKGGVGKSTAAVNLACCAADSGQPTLLWDLDAQGAASYYLGLEGAGHSGTRKVLQGKQDLRELAVRTRFPLLDVIPARFSYRKMDIRLERKGKPRNTLSAILGPLASAYAWVFLDCPAGISLLAESVFRAADLLLVPWFRLPSPCAPSKRSSSFSSGRTSIAPAYFLFFPSSRAVKRFIGRPWLFLPRGRAACAAPSFLLSPTSREWQ